MPRVLHVIETLGLGGAERLLTLTVRELKRTAYVNVVGHLLDEPRPWRGFIENEGIAVESLALRSPHAFAAAIGGLRRLIRRWRVDLVHSHLYFPNLYAQIAAWRERVPVVSTLHNLELEPEILRDNPRLTARKQAALRLASRAAIHLARPTLIAVSKAVRGSALRQLGVSADSVFTIHNGIDPDAVSAWPDPGPARLSLGLDPGGFVLAIVGRLVPLKGHRYLLEALPAVRRAAPATTILVLGDGPMRDELARITADRELGGSVRFLGGSADLVARVVAAADVLVAPSLSEGFGLAVLEAMAMSRACVASRTGGLPEIIEDGVSGLLVPPGDSAALAAALVRLARDPALREGLGRHARVAVETRFDVRDTARQLVTLYDTILARTAARKG